MSGTILIVDDNPSVIDSLSLFLKRRVARVLSARSPHEIPSILDKEPVDVILLDMNFELTDNSGQEGMRWLKEIKRINPYQVVLMITAFGDVGLAVEALKAGASDFILKPWDNHKLWATISSGLELSRSRQEAQQLRMQQNDLKRSFNWGSQSMLGQSGVMTEVFKTIQKVAPTDANVLILGENGTGKELVARQIHALSSRTDEVFITIDLGTISESLFESELFGHTKGAFTDAKEDKTGRLVLAHGGTLFLDEIGNLSQAMQAKLLTVLQNREVIPVGATNPIPIDVRLVSATNRDVHQLVESNRFREDLLYRINTIQIELPPLRVRGDDIILIASHYLAKYAEKYNKPNLTLGSYAVERLLTYPWPGNVRELSHAVERAVILCESNIISPNDLLMPNQTINVNLSDKPLSLEEAEKILIVNAMKRNKGNLSAVAKELGIGRQTLYRKMKEYGV